MVHINHCRYAILLLYTITQGTSNILFLHNFINETTIYYDDPLKPIYVTPENVDDELKKLTLPSMQTLKDRKKPFSFVVEGIVGTGKTTLLSAFRVSNFHVVGSCNFPT